MLWRSCSPSVSSFARARGLGSADAGSSFRPDVLVSQVDALQRLMRTANADQASGEVKARRVLKMMELAAVRPRFVREGPQFHGWWSNEYEDLIFS